MGENTVSSTSFHIGYNKTTVKNFELRKVSKFLQYLLPALETLPPKFSLIDIGCGPGSITFDLARRFQQARIIGLDQSNDIIERNQSSIEEHAPNTKLEFCVGNILRPESFLTPEEIEERFDVVHERTTLICIPSNTLVLKQMRALAKPNGGIVACRDGDTPSQIVWPPCPESDELQERLYRMKGLETQTGRQLTMKALEAGFRRDQIQASASVMSNIRVDERQAYAGSTC